VEEDNVVGRDYASKRLTVSHVADQHRSNGIVRLVAIAVYGATGYTGQLVVDELVRKGLDFVVSGRNEEKLAELSSGRAQGAPWRAASVDDPASLRAVFEGADVVINCAGPFTHYGEPVVKAAVDTGTHYLDSTGEQPFMQMVFERYGEAAESAGAALVSGMGFDYLPGDLIARLAAEGLTEPLDELILAYAVSGFGATRGTLRSALEMMKGGDVVYEGGQWRPAPSGVYRASFDFGGEIGRQPMARYPSGEVVTVPRHTVVRKVTSMITASTFSAHPALAGVTPYLMPGMALTLSKTPLVGALDKAIGRLPEGPSLDARKRARFTIHAVARGADGAVGRGWVTGSDIYGLTAVTLVHGAALMQEPGYDRAGALAPASAYDAASFLDALGGEGIRWEATAGASVKA
jgi:short subunit dehydrogenase-like uncharacterized protein